MNEADIAEYRRLRGEVEKRTTAVSSQLDNLRREQEAAKSANEFDQRRLQQSKDKLEQRNKGIDAERRNLVALQDTLKQQSHSLEEEKKQLKQLQEEVSVYFE